MEKRKYKAIAVFGVSAQGGTSHTVKVGDDLWAFVPLSDPVRLTFDVHFEATVPKRTFELSTEPLTD